MANTGSGAAGGSALGSALVIDDKLLSELDAIDNRLKTIQNTAKDTEAKLTANFGNMAKALNSTLGAGLDEIIKKIQSIASTTNSAAQTIASATASMGGGMNSAAQSAGGLGNSITGVSTAINQASASMGSMANISKASLMAARLEAEKLMNALKLQDGNLISDIQGKIDDINKSIKNEDNTLTHPEQQQLIEKKRMLEEELKELKRTFAEREVNAQKVYERLLKAEEDYQKRVRKAREQGEYRKNTTYEGALSYAKDAGSYNQMATAVKYLNEVLKNMPMSEQNFIEKSIKLKAEIDRLTDSMKALLVSDKKVEAQELKNAMAEDQHKTKLLELADAQKRKAAAAEEKARKEAAATYQKKNYETNTTYEGSLKFAERANTYNRTQRAVEYLTEAMRKLNRADEDYIQKRDVLNAKIAKLKDNLTALSSSTNTSSKEANIAPKIASNLKEWQSLNAQVAQMNARQEELNNKIKNYQTILERIKSGKGGYISTQSLNDLKALEAEYASNEKNIALLRAKQQQLVANNKELQRSIQLAEQNRAAMRGSLEDDRSKAVLTRMREYYKELERSSAEQAANQKRIFDEQVRASEASRRRMAQIAAEQRKFEAQQRSQKQDMYSSVFSVQNVSYKGAMTEAKYASTINERLRALELLKAARANLSTEEANYAKKLGEINHEIKRLDKANRDAVQSSKNLGSAYESMTKHHRRLLDTAGQLQRAFALMFSVSQIRNYITQIARVRGEFELQQRSLEALLQNKTQADLIFNKTVALAVKSPFQIKDLVSFTKQLAAYRIESDKLFDTTKRLADVSAGLGVDMQRIILAYGQVKAAAYLRGCLGYNTPIRMYDGSIKMVQDVVVGDVLINENGEKVNVKKLIRGREQMYIVRQTDGLDYRVNENHILTLYKNGCLHDIYVREYDSDYLGARYDDGKLTYGAISIEKDVVDDYFGFVLDGNKRFQLGDGTITHNTEVRQFTEAGINLYGELQAYFKEVKGEAYTTAQIVDMISKRKVTFEDIEAIFKRITDQGGLFYNMQAIQAETLNGKIANLRDSVDIMLNDIGKSNEGLFKGAIDGANVLLRNWESIATVGKSIIAILALVKLNSLMMGRTISEVFMKFAKFQKVSSASKGLDVINIAFKNVGIAAASAGRMIQMAFVSNAGLIAIAAAAAAVYKFVSYLNDCSEAYKKVAVENGNLAKSFIQISDAFDRAAESKTDKMISEKEKQLDKLKKLLSDEGLSTNVNINIRNDVDKQFDFLRSRYAEFLKFKRSMENSLVESNNEWEWGGLSGDAINEDIEDFEESYNKLISKTSELDKVVASLYDEYDNLNEAQKKILDEGVMRKKGQSDVEYMRQQSEAIKELTNTYGATFNKTIIKAREFNTELRKNIYNFGYNNSYDNAKNELNYEIDKLVKNAKAMYTKEEWEKVGKDVIRRVIDGMAAKDNWSEEVKNLFYERFNIPVQLDKDAAKSESKKIIDLIQDEFDKKNFKIKLSSDLLDPGDALGQIDDIAKSIDEWEKLIGNIERGTMKYWNGAALGINSPQRFKGWKGILDGAILFTKEHALKFAREQLAIARKAAREVGAQSKSNKNKANNTSRAQRDILSEQIALLKEMQSRYEKLQPMIGDEEAARRVRDYYAESLRYVQMPQSVLENFVPNKEGVIAALEKIIPTISDFKKRMDAKNTVAEMKIDIDSEALKKDMDKSKEEVETAFKSLDLYNELRKMGVGDGYIRSIFGDMPKTFEDVQRQIQETFAGKTGPEWEKLRSEQEKKFQEKVVQYNLDTFKELTQAYKTQLSDQLQLDLWYYEERRKIVENIKDTDLQKQYLGNLDSQYSKKTSENTWNGFKESDFYIRLFEQMETQSTAMLTAMREKLQSLKGELKDLTPEQLKEIVKQTQEIDQQLASRNPFKGLASDLKTFTSYLRNRNELEQKYLESVKKEDRLKQDKSEQTKKVAQAQEYYDNAVKTNGVQSSQALLAKQLLDLEKGKLDIILKELEAQGKITKEQADQIRNGEDSQKNLQSRFDSFNKHLQSAVSGYSEFESMLGNFGIELPKELSGALSGISQTSNGIKQFIDGDFVGGALTAVAGIGNTIGSIFGFGNKDKKLQKEIEKHQERVERLQKAYSDLKDNMDKAWGASNVIASTKEVQKNINAQIASLEAMARAEEDKKKTDSKKVQEYRDQIADLKKQLKELEEQKAQAFGAIGESTYKDAAQEFADAWVDAFNESSNSLDALNEKMDDLIENMLKKQLMQRAAQRYLAPVFDMFDKMFDERSDGGEIVTAKELEELNKMYGDYLEGFNEYAKNMFDQLGILPSSNSDLSKLQQGIQSMSENTGQALESLLNSIRFFVAQQSSDVSAIRALLASGGSVAYSAESTPMLNELRLQSNVLTKIYNTLNSVVAINHPKSGYGIKVFI